VHVIRVVLPTAFTEGWVEFEKDQTEGLLLLPALVPTLLMLNPVVLFKIIPPLRRTNTAAPAGGFDWTSAP
jgi:hypothetical protein